MKRIIDNDPQRVGEFVSRVMGHYGYSGYYAIGIEEDGEVIAGVVYDGYNGASISMHIAAVDGKSWMTPKALWYAFAYPFSQLGLRRINGFIAESNKTARAFAENIGFTLETRMKDAHPEGDMLVYRLLKEECRFIKRIR